MFSLFDVYLCKFLKNKVKLKWLCGKNFMKISLIVFKIISQVLGHFMSCPIFSTTTLWMNFEGNKILLRWQIKMTISKFAGVNLNIKSKQLHQLHPHHLPLSKHQPFPSLEMVLLLQQIYNLVADYPAIQGKQLQFLVIKIISALEVI